jgi:cation diffusion facilitator CzcD-associated flavoprotein CzcO
VGERVGIVGSGLGGFVAYATLRHVGLEPAEIAVFGDDPDPVGAWRPRAAAIRQRLMRSESDGHCWPTSFPGLAAREAGRRRDLAPLLLSVCDRYRPTVDAFLRHVEELRQRSRWDESFQRARVERVRAVEGGFELDQHGVFRHVLLAPGHPGLARPAELAGDPRVVHAYEPHEYAARVAVVGAGMAAATEWLNALEAGAEVVSVRRREPARRPLNVARPLFTKRGLAPFHATSNGERAELLRRFGEPSYPPGRSWDAPLEAAAREGRFRVEPELNGTALKGDGQVICATGFRRGFEHDPLLARVVAEHGLETEKRWIVLAPDSTVPALSDRTRTLSLAGVPAQWAYPAADTLVGMKYAARRFARRVQACPTR